jgi:hypothetical protein
MIIVGISILWLCAGFVVGMLIERHRWQSKAGTPSASHNTTQTAIALLSQWLAYEKCRSSLSNLPERTGKFLAQHSIVR